MRLTSLLIAAALPFAALPAAAQNDTSAAARADLADRDGNAVGSVTVRATPSNTVLVTINLMGLPAGGTHAVHFHETGDCSAPDFTSAGGHIADGADHGVLAQAGPHPGDLPNLVVDPNGEAQAEFFNDLITMDMLLDADGSAFIVHAGVDDYQSQPSGDAGDRLACGVFQPAQE